MKKCSMCKRITEKISNIFCDNDSDISRPWYMRLKSDLLRSILAPFFICFQYKVKFFLWFMFVIFASQLGTIINVIQRWVFSGWDLLPALGPESSSGNFYMFALVMISSLIGPIFVRFIDKNTPEYRQISFVYVTILVFSLLACALYYSFASMIPDNVNFRYLHNRDMCVDVKQLIFFILAFLFSWYSFGLSLLPEHETEANLDFDYQQREDDDRNKMSNKVNNIRNDLSVTSKNGENPKQNDSNFEDILL